MIPKILFLLGPVTIVLGAWRASVGLTAVGGAWFLLAFACEWHRRRTQEEVDARRREREAAGEEPEGPPLSTASFLRGTALLLLVGVPALVVGWAQLGIDEPDWRWLPLLVGAAVTALAAISTLLFLLGAGITAAAGPPPTVPATLVIVGMEQTGTYVNNQPRLEFVFDVRPEGGATYRVTKRATVPYTAVGSLEVGRGFQALVVGPEDPTNMEIDWSSPLPAEPAPPVDSLSERLRELDELKAKGLVTDEEYDAQRQRLLESL